MMKGSDEKIEKIKQVAFTLFLEIGYEATTVRMICKEAGIESPTLYYFFQSKKGLFLSLRNDMEEEYVELVKKLFLEKCDNPKEALKKYFKFCGNYALEYNDKTRFYLRYRLFKPTELVTEIEEYIDNSNKERQEQYFEYVIKLVEIDKLNCSAEYVFQKFNNFINSNIFTIIFSKWRPGEEELDEVWNIFVNCILKSDY
ncbi:MAG: TetR/AcrR family transcriptional regulator [Mobilitalea sp.]